MATLVGVSATAAGRFVSAGSTAPAPVARTPATATGLPLSSLAVPEWQWAAAHADGVPDWVQRAAAKVTVAVVDTGADVTAPTLAGRSPVTWSVTGNDDDVRDTVGHGTFVASLAAGSAAGGMAGFGADARLMVVQANRGNTGFTDVDEAAAITWAVDHGANIVNLSLGGTQSSPLERAAIAYAVSHGVLLVAAAGNMAHLGNPKTYPAALLGRNGIVVGAATSSGTRASFSSTGSYVDVLAPGVNVLGALGAGITSTLFSPVSTPGAIGSYALGSGTSFAAPEVTGAAALVWAANPQLSAAAVAQTIEGTASAHGAWTRNLAYGNLDVAAAVEAAESGATPAVSKPTPLAQLSPARGRGRPPRATARRR